MYHKNWYWEIEEKWGKGTNIFLNIRIFKNNRKKKETHNIDHRHIVQNEIKIKKNTRTVIIFTRVISLNDGEKNYICDRYSFV